MLLNGFSDNTIEKMKRLCDILSAIENSVFISKRLSLYGGTALNFLYLDFSRLSEDLDFNYRHIDKSDWGKTRETIDETIKWILNSLGYIPSNIKINAHYNHCRFHIRYSTEAGTKDDIKIEIGYMRRFPDLNNDYIKSFLHLTTKEKIRVMTPIKEELFANKFATMISRSKAYLNQRDIFDVYSLSKEVFDRRLFLELVALEIMLMNIPLDTFFQINYRLINGKTSGTIEHLINRRIDFETVRGRVARFSDEIVKDIQRYKIDRIIDTFYKTGKLQIESFQNRTSLNPHLGEHPQIKWLRKNKEKNQTD